MGRSECVGAKRCCFDGWLGPRKRVLAPVCKEEFYTVRGFNKIFKCSSLGRSGVGMRLDLEFWICDRVLDLYRD